MQLFYVQFWLILIFRSVWSVCNMSAYKNECYRTQFLNKIIFRFKLKSILLISTIYFQISEDKSTAVAAVAANSSCGCCGSKSEIKWRTDQLGFIRCFAWNSTKFLRDMHPWWSHQTFSDIKCQRLQCHTLPHIPTSDSLVPGQSCPVTQQLTLQ